MASTTLALLRSTSWYWSFTLTGAASLALFSWPTITELHQRWLSPSLTGGYLIVLLAALLLYRQVRRAPLVGPPQPGAIGVVWLGLCVLATLVGRAGAIAIVAHAALPMLVIAFMWSTFGWRSVRRFSAPLLFVYFAIPFWQVLDFAPFGVPSLNEGMRALTTTVVSDMVRATRITAFIEGNFVHLPSGTFEIAEGCSGRGFLIAAVELSLFYGLMYLERWKHRAYVVLAGAGLALIGNWVRVFSIIVVGHITAMQSPLVADHSTFGWVLFLFLVVGPMALLGYHLQGKEAAAPKPAFPRWERWRGALKMLPSSSFSSMQLALPLLAGALLAGGIWLDGRIQEGRQAVVRSTPIVLPAIAGWQPGAVWTGADVPSYTEPTVEAATWYHRGDDRVGVYVASYAAQRQGREAVYYTNRPQGNVEGETSIERGFATVVSSAGGAEQYAEWVMAGPGSRRLVWRSVRVAGRTTADEMAAKVYQVVGAFTGRSDAQVLVATAECETACSRARRLLSEFAAEAAASLYASAEQAALAEREDD